MSTSGLSAVQPSLIQTAFCASCGEAAEIEKALCPACGRSVLLDSRYRLTEILGRSPTRTTYRAVRIEDGETVAIKELLFRRMEGAKTFTLFEREIEVLASLDHPAIPRLFEGFTVANEKRGGCYLVRELIEGESLAELASREPFSLAHAARLAADVLDVLDYLHGLRPPVVHRDITPANVLRRVDGTLALIDFGAVRAATTPDGSTIAGTFGAMAPEQLRGIALPASDIHGVGALLLSLVSGRPVHELLERGYRLNPSARLPRGPVLDLVERMLRADPEQRPASAGALARALRQAAEAPPSPRVLPWLGGALLASGVAVALGFALSPTSETRASAPLPKSAQAHAATPLPPPPDPPPEPTGLSPSRPAPLPPEFRPACLDRGCASVADGFAGFDLDAECGALLEPGRPAPAASRARNAREIEIGGVMFSCVAHQQNGHFCNLLCETSSTPAWAAAERVVRWVGDRHGAPTHTDERDHRRTWTWRSGESFARSPELLVLADEYPNSGRLSVSYRGPFGRNR